MRKSFSPIFGASLLPTLLSALVLVLAACSSTPRQLALPARALAAPAAVPAREFQQVLIARYNQREAKMLVAGRISATAIDLNAMTPQGAPLFNVHFDGKTARIDRQIGVPDGLSPQSILEDLQLVYWPSEQLNQLWRAADTSGWQVQSTAEGRELKLKAQSIITVKSGVDPWSETVELQHHAYSYHLTITTISQKLISPQQLGSPQKAVSPE